MLNKISKGAAALHAWPPGSWVELIGSAVLVLHAPVRHDAHHTPDLTCLHEVALASLDALGRDTHLSLPLL